MSKSRKVNKNESVFAKVVKADKRSVLRSVMDKREHRAFKQHTLRDLVSGVEYL